MTHRSKHLPNGGRITDELAMGILARTYPTQRVKEILQQQGKASQRERELPAHLMVYYVMGLAQIEVIYLHAFKRQGTSRGFHAH